MSAGDSPRSVVTFAMQWVPQYRVAFYQGIRAELARRNVEMRLVHGDPPGSRQKRNDASVVPWAEYVPNRVWTIGGLELTLQPVARRLRGSDLVVLQQETGLLLNYWMLGRARVGGPKVALWGHGHNFNPREASSLAEFVKRRITKFADWAFAYTERSASVFESIGVPADSITVVQNSLDISPMIEPSGRVSDEVARLVSDLRDRGARVGWIVSAFDDTKRVPFLIEVLDRCAERIEGFAFVALGAGDELPLLTEAASTRPWLDVLGARFGPDKAAIGEIAEVTVHPGLAGLHVIETFATQSPMVTADIDYHSHETTYLGPDNSVVLRANADADDFACAVAELFGDDVKLATLQAGCDRASKIFTLESMVQNFADGVERALERS